MKKKFRVVLVGILVLQAIVGQVIAQSTRVTRSAKADKDPAAYTSMISGGITTNTNSGILGGAVVRHSQLLPGEFNGKKQYRYLALELVNVKHASEFSERLGYSRFSPNKINSFFAIRPEFGREIVLFNRNNDEGIAVSTIFAIGPTLGLEKPTMVRVQETRNRVSTVQYDPAVHNYGNLVGTSFFAGFDKVKFVPGIHAKAALTFELSTFRDSVTGVEVGFLVEAFTRKAEIMVNAENRSIFTSGFISLYFGKTK